MRIIFIPVLLSILGPGVGQIYNKDYKKGIYLLVVSTVVFVAACVWCFKASQQFLPPDLTAIDPSALQTVLMNAATQVAKSGSPTLMAYQGILMALWFYSIFDAANGALRRHARLQKK